MSLKFGRREFLQALSTSVATQTALFSLMDSILSGITRKAYGQTLGRKYIYIQQAGAPPRHMYDLFLTPYSTAGYTAPGALGTVYNNKVNGSYTGLTYQTTALKGINVPPLWRCNIPKPGGSTRPMADLLDNLLHIRGITTGNSSHPASQQAHFRPFGARYSIPGLVANASTLPIKALDIHSSSYVLSAPRPISPTQITNVSGNVFSQLLAPFTLNTTGLAANFVQNRNSLWTPIVAALNALNAEAADRNPSSQAMQLAQQEALDMMSRQFGDLDQQWNTLKNKYTDLITRSVFTRDVVGINDSPVGASGSRPNAYAIGNATVSLPDLRDMFVSNQTTISEMAEHFAIAEFVINQNISDSIAISPRSFKNLYTDSNSSFMHGFDEHGTGNMASLIVNALYYRALSACTMELIESLKRSNKFNDTAVIVGGEFNRVIQTGGSDHGWQGASVCIYSGIIQGPKVIGNIKQSLWGAGASVPQLGMQLDLGHLGATLAAILNVESPLTARSSLVSVQGGTVSPLIELARQV